ncbi:MAG: hypothetical protein LBS71_03045 [Puniceicoccales bacterium]|jgi:hypothetical protein|nr:hypothetical protein [Puniceicoccales bacterium]
MPTYTPFLCRVTPYGTPFFVSLESSSNTFAIDNLSAEDVCYYYWLLESVTIHYKMTFSGSLEIQNNLLLGGMYGTVPQRRVLDTPSFNGSIFHSSSGVQVEGRIDLSKIYLQPNGLYAIDFKFIIYARSETIDGSNFLLSFYRSIGNSGQRNSYKTQDFSFLGETKTIYLNYNSQIWSESEIELNEFSITTTFFSNDM